MVFRGVGSIESLCVGAELGAGEERQSLVDDPGSDKPLHRDVRDGREQEARHAPTAKVRQFM